MVNCSSRWGDGVSRRMGRRNDDVDDVCGTARIDPRACGRTAMRPSTPSEQAAARLCVLRRSQSVIIIVNHLLRHFEHLYEDNRSPVLCCAISSRLIRGARSYPRCIVCVSLLYEGRWRHAGL